MNMNAMETVETINYERLYFARKIQAIHEVPQPDYEGYDFVPEEDEVEEIESYQD